MKRWIAAAAVALGVLAYHGQAHAACTSQTYIFPDGKVLVCLTCCYGVGNCTTTCS